MTLINIFSYDIVNKKMYNDFPIRKDINGHYNIETPDKNKYPRVNYTIRLVDKDYNDNGELVLNKVPEGKVYEYSIDKLDIKGIKMSHKKDYASLWFTYENVLYTITVDTKRQSNLDTNVELDKIVNSLK